MGTNTKYKSSLFSWLFSDPETLRELYCAIEGILVDPALPVIINTLEDVFFMNQKNDISFVIGGKLVVLIEHQSTINPNMPLRFLMYVGRVYEKIIEDRNRFSVTKLPIPQPEFIVLYNGEEPCPDVSTLKLSDAFMDAAGAGLTTSGGSIPLELTVRIYNINEGRNEAMAENCKKLKGYSRFVAKAREFKKSGKDSEEAIKMAILYCINHDILKNVLRDQGSEVINMLFGEWDMDTALAVREEDGWKKGLEEGLEKGLEEGREEGEEKARKELLELLEKGYRVDQIKAILSSKKEGT
ncbi:hypothetical protein AGMMS49942_21150 [Spirochaetia bacterium]|nr:hypothetical protein AGMMS49942_21150 [Spirochaetia bacterium]